MYIKDYILDNDVEFVHKEKKTQEPKQVTFSTVYENDTDFILKKQSQRVEKELVCLVSQGQIYIKNCKNNEVEKVDEVRQVSNFKKDMTTTPVFNKLIWSPFIDFGYLKINDIWDTLLKHKETFKILANKKLNPFKFESLVYRFERNPETFKSFDKVEKLVRCISPKISVTSSRFENIADNLQKANITINMLTENENLLAQLPENEREMLFASDNLYQCFTEYNCNFKAFLTWLVYTVRYRNRVEVTNWYGRGTDFYVGDYIDYLRMQKEMYGKVKEKYPDYWMSEEHIMNCKYNDWKEMNKTKMFSLNQEKIKDLEYEEGLYRVIVPLQSADIVDEAQQQQHCVASYVDKVREGLTHILFIRTRLNDSESLLTVEVTPDRRIVQVRGFQNRPYTKLEYDFMKDWAAAKELKLEVPDVEGV